jgi:hypothetical protein
MKTMTFHPELTPAAAKARGYLADLTAGAMATLAQIGIKRTEIWAHVEKITADEVEYDGL